MKPPEVVFVLPAGGSAGAVQVGILRSLVEAGIMPDALVGCSVGALNAACFAADPTIERVKWMEGLWRRLRASDVFGSAWHRAAARVIMRRDHLCSPDPLRALIRSACTVDDLAALRLPVHVVTTDLDHGLARWWTAGPVEEILYASACLPGLLPPAMLDGARHVDGGVLEPVPVTRAVDLDASDVYVLGEPADPHELPRGGRSALDVLLRSFTISRYSRLAPPGALGRPGQRVTVIPGADTAGIAITDFSHSARLMAQSRERSRRFLADTPAGLVS